MDTHLEPECETSSEKCSYGVVVLPNSAYILSLLIAVNVYSNFYTLTSIMWTDREPLQYKHVDLYHFV